MFVKLIHYMEVDMDKKITRSLAAIMTGAVLFTGVAMAHDHSTGNAEADLRIAEMKKLGANMGAISKFAKGEVAYSDALIGNAKEVAAIAANMDTLFPEGSGVEESRAKPEIWNAEYKDAFEKDIAEFKAASDKLVVAVEGGDAATIGAALKETGASCGACHKQFRKPKD
jgi:cytochrome c556|tara:strand:- start:184 stop:693 length:510 start_codon:yes stop_codon:yes gene_type:complete